MLFAGLYSSSGASYKILQMLNEKCLKIVISTPLLFEYEDVLKRKQSLLGLQDNEIDTILDVLCASGEFQPVYFLWRPYLSDPKDDMVLELAVAAKVPTIVSHNLNDFTGVDKFGVQALSPKNFLESLQ